MVNWLPKGMALLFHVVPLALLVYVAYSTFFVVDGSGSDTVFLAVAGAGIMVIRVYGFGFANLAQVLRLPSVVLLLPVGACVTALVMYAVLLLGAGGLVMAFWLCLELAREAWEYHITRSTASVVYEFRLFFLSFIIGTFADWLFASHPSYLSAAVDASVHGGLLTADIFTAQHLALVGCVYLTVLQLRSIVHTYEKGGCSAKAA